MSGNVFGTPKKNNFFGSNDKNLNPIQDDVFGKRPPVQAVVPTISFIKVFLTAEWVYDALEDNYSISIPEADHKTGRHPIMEIHEYDGVKYSVVTLDGVTIDNDGNIHIICNQPFDGKIVIV